MKEFVYVMQDPQGNHARPAGEVVATAKKYTSKTSLWVKDQSYDLKKLLMVMGAPIKQGDEVVIRVEGDDEEACAKDLKESFDRAFKG
jgi:phosphocarrier protein